MGRAFMLAMLWALGSCSSSDDGTADVSLLDASGGDASADRDAVAPDKDAASGIDASNDADAAIDGGAEIDAGTPDCIEPPGAIRVTSTIQAALDGANAGDTVVVPAGTYPELVSFPRSGDVGAPITLMAACGATVLLD